MGESDRDLREEIQEMTGTPTLGHLRRDHEDCECAEELDHDLHDCDCLGYPLTKDEVGARMAANWLHGPRDMPLDEDGT